METRFKTVRTDYQEMLKDQDHKRKFTQSNLSEEFKKRNFWISRETIGKLETGNPSAPVTKDVLLAYHTFFGVSSDWLLGISNTRYPSKKKGDISFISNYIGISEEAIKNLKNYSKIEKDIINLLIEDDTMLLVLFAIYNYFPDNFNEAEKTITDEVGYKFHRFMSMEIFQKVLDCAHNSKYLNIVFKVHAEKEKGKIIEGVSKILMDSVSRESYEEYKNTGKKYGYILPEWNENNET